MTIRELAYELYKMDWMRRISCGVQMEVLKEYYQETDKDYQKEYSFGDYVFENGYHGQLYVCYNEFLRAEYLDESYMRSLFYKNDELFKEYQEDLKTV